MESESRSAVAGLQAEVRTHCNGDHLRRRDLDELRGTHTKDVETMTAAQAKLATRLEEGEQLMRQHQRQHEINLARDARGIKLAQIVITAITAVVVGGMTAAANYFLLASKLAGH